MASARSVANCMAWLIVGLCASMPAAELPRPTALPTGPRQQVVLAVARDLNLDPGLVEKQLQLLAPPHEVPSDIRVVSAKRDLFRSRWLIRLGCRRSQNVLPFDVVLNAPELDLAVSARRWVAVSGGTSEKLPVTGRSELHNAAVVHKGEKVEMVEEFGQVKLVAKAVSLDAGAVGDRVRVRNASSHRLVMATVAGPKMVGVGVVP